MRKRLFTILLCLTLLAGDLHYAHAEETPAPAEAESTAEDSASEGGAGILASGTCGDNLTWTLSDDGELIVSGTGDIVNGITEGPWHSVRRSIKKATVKSGVTGIGALAFYDCINLTDVSIPESVTRLGNGVFANCRSLASIAIPDSVGSLGEEIFANCNGLTDVKLPVGMKSIPHSMFFGCTGLTELAVPESVTIIKANAFYSCSGLAGITLPKSVSEIERTAFYNCDKLSHVIIPNDSIWIEENAFEYSAPVIYAHEGSAAAAFAAEHGLSYRKYTDGMEIPAEEPSSEEPSLEEPSTEPVTENTSGETPAEKPPVEEPSTQPASEEPSGETPEEKPSAEPVTEEPSTEPTVTTVVKKTYTVKFAANGGTGTMTSQKMAVGETEALKANTFKRTGYHFSSWNTKKDGSGKSYADEASVRNLKTTNGASITLYARWKKNTYTIRFNANGGTGKMADKKMTYGSTSTLTANAFKRSGYKFAGWNTKADGSGRSYANRASVKNLTSVNGGVVTLYAKWTRSLSKVTLSGSSTVKKGLTIQLSCSTTPSGFEDSVTYTSSNKAVATVSSSGVVKGVGVGTATITAKGPGGVKATKRITVAANSYSFGSAGTVASNPSGVTIKPKKLSYSGSTLVLTAYVVNNSSYTIDTYNNLTITVYTASGQKIASKGFGSVTMNVSPRTVKTMTFKFPGTAMADLTKGGYLKTSGNYWFH